MNRKIIGIIISMALILTLIPLNASSGDEENPEITDQAQDTILKHFDIISAWFFENPDEPNYLFISMKLNDLKNYWIGAAYLVEWTSSSGRWASSSILGTKMDNEWRCGDYSEGSNGKFDDLQLCDGTIDNANNIITWKVPKDKIGNPEPGDALTNTQAVTCIAGHYLFLLPLRSLPRFYDYAPNEGYGLDYIIKY